MVLAPNPVLSTYWSPLTREQYFSCDCGQWDMVLFERLDEEPPRPARYYYEHLIYDHKYPRAMALPLLVQYKFGDEL